MVPKSGQKALTTTQIQPLKQNSHFRLRTLQYVMSPDNSWFQEEDLLVFSFLPQVTSYVLAKKTSFLKTSKLDIHASILQISIIFGALQNNFSFMDCFTYLHDFGCSVWHNKYVLSLLCLKLRRIQISQNDKKFFYFLECPELRIGCGREKSPAVAGMEPTTSRLRYVCYTDVLPLLP